jgi:hypothetical protein
MKLRFDIAGKIRLPNRYPVLGFQMIENARSILPASFPPKVYKIEWTAFLAGPLLSKQGMNMARQFKKLDPFLDITLVRSLVLMDRAGWDSARNATPQPFDQKMLRRFVRRVCQDTAHRCASAAAYTRHGRARSPGAFSLGCSDCDEGWLAHASSALGNASKVDAIAVSPEIGWE